MVSGEAEVLIGSTKANSVLTLKSIKGKAQSSRRRQSKFFGSPESQFCSAARLGHNRPFAWHNNPGTGMRSKRNSANRNTDCIGPFAPIARFHQSARAPTRPSRWRYEKKDTPNSSKGASLFCVVRKSGSRGRRKKRKINKTKINTNTKRTGQTQGERYTPKKGK